MRRAFRLVAPFGLMLGLMLSGGCERSDPEAARRKAAQDARARLLACLPDQASSDQVVAEAVHLAIGGVELRHNATAVQLVAYTIDEEAEFHLPVYLLSRGRWLIDERGRAYLLDTDCREYKLKDRKTAGKESIPLDGRVRLKAGEAYAIWLEFPRLPERAREGVLVYGARVLPFSLLLSAGRDAERNVDRNVDRSVEREAGR